MTRTRPSDPSPDVDSPGNKVEVKTDNPVVAEVQQHDVTSAVTVAGHPIHAMSVHFPIVLVICTLGADLFYWFSGDPFYLRASVWTAGFAFGMGVAAALVGTAELLLVKGIRSRVGSWTHAVAAMMLIAVAGANWGVRLIAPQEVIPHGLALSILASIFVSIAGWHGGKLVFSHGVGLMVSTDE